MCGIFGWSFHKQPEKEVISILGAVLADEMDSRGGDSWGWYTNEGNINQRGIGNMAISGTVLSLARANNLIAHTRKATTGANIIENCHPFILESLVGCHNGIVHNHIELNKTHSRTCAVDSQHIFHHIQEKKDLKEIEAYGAICFQYKDNPNIYLGKFNGGTLEVAKTEYGIIWASTLNALHKATKMAGMKDVIIYKLEEEMLYSVKISPEDGQITKKGEMGLYESHNKLNFDKPTYSNYNCGYNTYGCSGKGSSHTMHQSVNHRTLQSSVTDYKKYVMDNNDFDRYSASDFEDAEIKSHHKSLEYSGHIQNDFKTDIFSDDWLMHLSQDEIEFFVKEKLLSKEDVEKLSVANSNPGADIIAIPDLII